MIRSAGFDIEEKQYGTCVKGKPKIYKRGNRHLRKSIHLPSLSSVRHAKTNKEFYSRLVATNGIKMKALLAIQSKLLALMFILAYK